MNEDIRGQAGIGAYLVDGSKHTFQIQGGYNYERELRQEFGSAIEQNRGQANILIYLPPS